jgi:hypothetical protein
LVVNVIEGKPLFDLIGVPRITHPLARIIAAVAAATATASSAGMILLLVLPP